ncbi:MAG TPA: M24 family metallopeptidase [Vicinamibacterales bacterium]|nr:M24 family metallopeptidase [Vicinamibacterales bacterium]
MPIDIRAVQQALRDQGLDGWLLYDFQGSNPIAARLAEIGSDGGHLASRRWFYLIPATGEPQGLVHAIERHNLDRLPGQKIPYAGRTELEAALKALLSGTRRIAMEYSPKCAIPYVSRVDAGTIEMVRGQGVDVVSSGDLVQQFEAHWSSDAIASHKAAAARLYRIKDRAFETAASRVRDGGRFTEFDLQQLMCKWFSDEGLVSDSAPNVSAQENAGNPHYLPTADKNRPIGANELLLLDLWGKLDHAGSVFADITWVGYTGRDVPDDMTNAFGAIRDARDAAIRVVEDAARAGREVRGYEVDRAARAVIEQAGYGRYIIHRTGHSLGETVHGNGAHLDDYETHDERRLLPGTGFTIEPGVYFDRFGVRTEINMVWGPDGPEVTGPRQHEIVSLV